MNDGTKKDHDAGERHGQGDSKVIKFTNNDTANFAQKQVPKKKGKKASKGTITMGQKVYSLAIKCYHEQLTSPDLNGEVTLANNIFAIDPGDMEVIAIKHDKDEVTDGIWKVSTEKPHFHIIVRMRRKYDNGRVARKKVSTILNQLGIAFRPDTDDLLISSRGLEQVGNFSAYTAYLTHETKQAREDGKHIYKREALVSNLTGEEIDDIRAKQIKVDDNAIKDIPRELIRLDTEAYELGYNLGSYAKWYNDLPFILRSNAKMKTIAERYNAGIEDRIATDNDVLRLCIFIKGAPNTGKTYASMRAIPHDEVLRVGGGGSGKFDNLRPDHGAILIDDDKCPNLLNATDNYIARMYRRNSNNPVWAGDHFIVTSNLFFPEWLEGSGLKVRAEQKWKNGQWIQERPEHYDAMLSRFFVCEVKEINGINKLVLISASTRGTQEEQAKRMKMFLEFKEKFDASLAEYQNIKNGN